MLTIIALAREEDGDARWVKHKGKPSVHGFKAHVGADAAQQLSKKLLSALPISKPGTSRFTAHEARLRRYLEHGNEAMVCARCDGVGSPKPTPRTTPITRDPAFKLPKINKKF